MRVDSPGGSGLASDIIWHALENAKKKKPVVVSMSDVAASGGYYISTGANKIVAEPSTITGSIGVVAGKPVVKGLYDWLGITNEYVMKGEAAGMFRETEKFDKVERPRFEAWIQQTYKDFITKVAAGRNKDATYINSIGQGRVWTGSEGKDKGLVDEFGGLERAIQLAKELAKLPRDKDVRRIVFPYPRTLIQDLLNTRGDDETVTETTEMKQRRAVISAMPEDAQRALRFALMLDKMKQGDAMLVMPFDLRVR